MSLRRLFSNLAGALSVGTLLLLLGGRSAYGQDKCHREGRYIAIDFHQHTTYTDGSNPIATVMDKNDEFGLDWWANSEHGGVRYTDGYGPILAGPPSQPYDDLTFARFWDNAAVYPAGTILGDVKISGNHQGMWRWQSVRDFSFCDVLTARALYDRPIVQGLEWNVPGHEHCSTGIIGDQFECNPNASAMAEFDYLFDASDTDGTLTNTGGLEQGWTGKNFVNNHEKAVQAAEWMQFFYPWDSWMVPAHVERQKKYTVSDFRDLNNAAPSVCFGFESMPGHQKEPDRGSYGTNADGGGTYGGCGIYAAKVGNLWDALLGEGRYWWLFASSDFHSTGADFWPGEYQKTYVKVADPDDPWSIVDGMRSGNIFVVEGDLIDALDFSVKYRDDDATMGETLVVKCDKRDKSDGRRGKNEQVTITIRFHSPRLNNNGDPVRVDHLDLIAGDITGLIPPGDPRYTNATNSTARVLARFKAGDWKTKKNGWKEIVFQTRLQKHTYLRLRGTNNSLSSSQIDPATGDPALDVPGTNTAAQAWSDLWFYSNPIFVKVL